MNDRAVSETLGFILMFSVMLLSITAVGTFGVDALQTTQQNTMVNNGEHAFIDIAGAMEDVHRENVSSRTSRMRLGTGRLEVGDATEISVDIDGNPRVSNAETHPIIYEVDGIRLIYVAGAVFRIQDGGAVVVHDPSMEFENDEVIFPVVVSNADEGQAVSNTQAAIRMFRGSQTVHTASGANDVTIEIEVPSSASDSEQRAELWKEVLEPRVSTLAPGDECTVSGSIVTCDHRTTSSDSQLIVRAVNVNYDFEA